ncbi:response regulator [Clostridium sp. DMHC 10]|uniref:response regulator n=1 Tax=Clostridium sp. DMHC 10 TaxID=747377 RepID=UPI00069EA7BD|nr:response regulator [Clostridium sp. DMHC 10]
MLSVFIADDDRIIRKGLVKIIDNNMKEFKIVGEAANGSAALEKIKELKPDILVTDIKMPVMDGIELINNIKKLSLKTRSIVLSGFDDYKFIRETFKNGAVDYILKPIDNKILFQLLEKIKEDIENETYEKEKEEKYKNRIKESTSFLKEKVFE